MAVLVWVSMATALWHFAIFVPDRFHGGLIGAFLFANGGAALARARRRVSRCDHGRAHPPIDLEDLGAVLARRLRGRMGSAMEQAAASN